MKKILSSIVGLFFFFLLFLFLSVYRSNADGNLLSYWKFDETTTGSTVIDSSGNGYNGTPHNNPAPSTDVPSTITFSDPESLSFNGTDQYVSVPDNSAFAMTSATFSVWVKFNSLSNDMEMIAKRSDDGVQWQFGYSGGTNEFKVTLANDGAYGCCDDFRWSPSPSITTGVWYNIAVSINGSTKKLRWYQNGIFKQQDSIPANDNLGTQLSTAQLTLGATSNGTAEFLDGYLDDVRIYNTALTDSDISDIASGDSGPGVPTPTQTPTPTPTPTPSPTPTVTPTSTPSPTAQPTTSNANSNSNSESSAPSTISTPVCSAQAPPGTPNLFQIDTQATQATLFFSPVNNPVSNYYVSYGYSSGDDRFGTLTNQGASSGVLSYIINDLLPNTVYYFRIRPQNDCMPGNFGNEMKIITTKESANAIRYYKNFVSQIFSVFSQQTTVLGTAVKKSNQTSITSSCNYTVQPGDSLWNIAQMKLGTGFDYPKIEKEDNLSSTVLHIGQILQVGC
jgi:concanavalin A-like lectin/glucanase superfamily protein/LysM domain-containing protein